MSKGVTPFTVEQPARLNHLVDETIPLTWQVRWHGLKVCLPLLAFSSVCIVEIIFIRAWLADQMAGVWLTLVLGFLFPPILVLIMSEVQIRIYHVQKRRLSFKKRGLVFQVGDLVCPWESLAGFRFEPIVNQPQLKRCYILGRGPHGQIIMRPKWSLALDAAQRQALLKALPIYHPAGLGEIRIEDANTIESAVHVRRVPFAAMSLCLLGLLLCLNGAPLAFVFFGDKEPRSREHTSDFVVAERRDKQIAEFVTRHFSSLTEFRAWAFWTGVTITVLGAGAIAGGVVLLNRASPSTGRRDSFNSSSQTPGPTESAAPRRNSESLPG